MSKEAKKQRRASSVEQRVSYEMAAMGQRS
jgi:hypothetical protein